MSWEKAEIKRLVIESYSAVATGSTSCLPQARCCAPGAGAQTLLKAGRRLGYSDEELKVGLGEANLGLGCGNPQAIADLKEGETVLDLGSGSGFDSFLSILKVGKAGAVVGIDLTPEMVAKATENARRLGLKNVVFMLGEIEHLPVKNASVDVIISNCVINLSPDKQAAFNEAFRVLRPGGRIAISDILKKGEFSETVRQNKHAYSG